MHLTANLRRLRVSVAPLAALTFLLGACAAPQVPEPAAQVATQPSPVLISPPASQAAASPVARSGERDAITIVLAYADRARLLSPSELNADIARLTDKSKPTELLELALALSQQRQLPELIRAQEAVARVLGDSSADAQALHPLARLLAARYAEQRRLEDQTERQNQALRDVQRRLDQTTERLEALKAIERSLSNRPVLTPSAPISPGPAARPRAPASRASAPPVSKP